MKTQIKIKIHNYLKICSLTLSYKANIMKTENKGNLKSSVHFKNIKKLKNSFL